MRKRPTPPGKFKMPGRRRRYNVRFSPGRVKKIMQKNADVGKMAMAVPVLISKILELFATSLVEKAKQITQSRNSRTLSVQHVKQCVDSDMMYEFLKDTVERAFVTYTAKENQKKASWPRNRRRWQDVPVKTKPSKMKEAPKMVERRKRVIPEPVYKDDSSSESELYICLDV